MIVQFFAQLFLSPAAYIDPSSGGFLFQILAVAFTFISGLIILFSNQIRHLWTRLRHRKQTDADGSANESSSDHSDD